MMEIIKANLLRAQQRMKNQADKHHQERQFAVGDWVYLKLQPHIQQSVVHRTNNKLSFKFFGPYLVTQKVGAVAYKLQLPPSSRIHPVVHVSQLKKAMPPDTLVSSDDDLLSLFATELGTPVQIQSSRLCTVGNKLVPFGRVQWSNLPQSWTTWENLRTMKVAYPQLSLPTL